MRRRTVVGLAGIAVVAAAGCAQRPSLVATADTGNTAANAAAIAGTAANIAADTSADTAADVVADGAAHADDTARADSFLAAVDALRLAHRIPGLALVVLRDQRVLLARGLGVTAVDGGTPVGPDTLFDIASVAKPLSAVVALRLAERGVLKLDRPLALADGFAAFCAGARQQGGLFFSDFACDSTQPPLTLRHLLTMTANGTPGSRFFYNPVAFSWASRPMAQAAGLAFSDLVVREVFEPAGMHGAARIHRARPLPAALRQRLALPHRTDAQCRSVRAPEPPAQGDGAAGGVVASALDLARFDVALDSGRLLSAASMRALWTVGPGAAAAAAGPGASGTPAIGTGAIGTGAGNTGAGDTGAGPRGGRAGEGAGPGASEGASHVAGQSAGYGIGWFVGTLRGEPAVWHTGVWDDAYSALYLKLPARRLSVILLANSDGLRWPQRLDEAVLDRSPFAQAAHAAFVAAAGRAK